MASGLSDFVELINGSGLHPTALEQTTLDYGDALDLIPDLSGYSVTQLSATQVELTANTAMGTYQVVLTGSGLTPVSSLSELIAAIDTGVASGAFSRIEFTGPPSFGAAPVTLIALDVTATGYTYSSGNQSLEITGDLPATLEDLANLSDAFDLFDRMDSLTPAEEAQLNTLLAQGAVSGITLRDSGTELLNLSFSDTQLSFSVEGYTLQMNGTFPDDLAELLGTVLDIEDLIMSPGGFTSLAQVPGLALETLTITGPGTVPLLTITGPITDEASAQIQNFTIDGVFVIQNGVQLLETASGNDDYFTGGRPFADYVQWSDTNGAAAPNGAFLFGFGGSDTLVGTDDNDYLFGGTGGDLLRGGVGNDSIEGGSGNDTLVGGEGDDQLEGGDGTDTLNGGDGDDTILGGDTEDDLRDVVYAGAGNDNVDGGHGNDLIYGMNGNDTIAGGFGADDLQGQDGDDVITGSAYADLIFGGAGNDFVNGGFGHDLINGGTGADKFYHLGILDHGSDWVQDYNAAEGDVLLFGDPGATADDFQINLAHTANAAGERSGDDDVQEAFVIYRPTGQIVWALVDGAGQDEINLKIGSDTFDLLA